MNRALAALAIALVSSCARPRRGAPNAGEAPDASAPRAASTASATASAVVSASAAPAAPATSATSAAVPADPVDPDEELLAHSTLAALTPEHGLGARKGAFDAVLVTSAGRRPALAEPALASAPTAYKAPLAYYRLARALGMHVVPVTVVRSVPVAELGAAVDGNLEARALLKEVRVLNDGTVDVLVRTRASRSAGSPWDAPPGTPFGPDEGPEARLWDRWASSPSPAPHEDGAVLRDYLEMLVLDYLAANVARRSAMRAGPSALVLVDNATAFPARLERPLLDRLLRKLRAAARFPRGLYDALRRFDRARAARTFEGGAFEGWLLSPRTLIELDERRAALLTLLEARIAERGAAAVLSL